MKELVLEVFDWYKDIICIKYFPIFIQRVTDLKYFTQGFLIRIIEALYARLSYLFVRNSLYKIIYDKFKPPKLTNDLSHREKSVIAAIAGGFGAAISHPFDTLMTRKIADIGKATNYIHKNV